MNLRETLKEFSNFKVEMVLHLEVPEEDLSKRSYKYPFDDFCSVFSKDGKIFTSNKEIFYDTDYVLDKLPKDLKFKLDISKINKNIVDLFGLNKDMIFEVELDDVGHSEKIILLGLTQV